MINNSNNDVISHYGYVDSVNIASGFVGTYREFGIVGLFVANAGNVKIENNAHVVQAVVGSTSTMTVDNNAKVGYLVASTGAVVDGTSIDKTYAQISYTDLSEGKKSYVEKVAQPKIALFVSNYYELKNAFDGTTSLDNVDKIILGNDIDVGEFSTGFALQVKVPLLLI